MQQKYILYCQHTIQHSEKLEFYNICKNDYTRSYYLDLTKKSNERKELVKFQISNHKLIIEIGRYCMIKSLRKIDFVLLVDLIKLKINFTSFSSVLST